MTEKEFQKLGFMFANGFDVNDNGVPMGKGLWERDLERWGFNKAQMKKLVAKGVIRETITRHRGETKNIGLRADSGWRKTYVLPNPKKEEATNASV